MFNKEIFKQSFKSSYILWLALTLVSSILLIQFSAMEDLTVFVGAIYYQMLAFLLPTIYILITTNKLMCAQVDSGSMAYTLASPVKRVSVAFSQLVYLLGSIVVMFLVTMLINLCTNQIVETYKASEIIFMNLSTCVTCMALCSIFYLVSTVFNLSKKTLGVNGILSGVFILSSILAMFSSALPNMGDGMKALKIFRFTSIFSLIDINSITAGSIAWIVKMTIAFVLTGVASISAAIVFKKKDLPL